MKIAFLNSPVKIIICIGVTQYPRKEQRNQVIEEDHSSTIGEHKGVTKTYNIESDRDIIWRIWNLIYKNIHNSVYNVNLKNLLGSKQKTLW